MNMMQGRFWELKKRGDLASHTGLYNSFTSGISRISCPASGLLKGQLHYFVEGAEPRSMETSRNIVYEATMSLILVLGFVNCTVMVIAMV